MNKTTYIKQKNKLCSCSNVFVVVDDLFFHLPSPQLQRWRCSLLQGKGCGPSQLSCCLTKSGHWDATCNNQRGWGWCICKVQDNWWKQKRPHGDRNGQVETWLSHVAYVAHGQQAHGHLSASPRLFGEKWGEQFQTISPSAKRKIRTGTLSKQTSNIKMKLGTNLKDTSHTLTVLENIQN